MFLAQIIFRCRKLDKPFRLSYVPKPGIHLHVEFSLSPCHSDGCVFHLLGSLNPFRYSAEITFKSSVYRSILKLQNGRTGKG